MTIEDCRVAVKENRFSGRLDCLEEVNLSAGRQACGEHGIVTA